MNRYQVSVPHVVIGMAAMAMTAATLALAVVVPATSDCGTSDVRTIAARRDATAVDIQPARIEVVATRGSLASTSRRATI